MKFFDEADAYISELTFMEGGKEKTIVKSNRNSRLLSLYENINSSLQKFMHRAEPNVTLLTNV